MLDNDEGTIKKIKESLDFLDSSVEVKKPDVMQLLKLVNEVEEKKNSTKNKQFIIFIITAVFAICLETYSFNKSAGFFVVVQIIAFISVVPAIILWIRKRNRQVSL